MRVLAMGRFILFMIGIVLLAIFILICCVWGVFLSILIGLIMFWAYRLGHKHVAQ